MRLIGKRASTFSKVGFQQAPDQPAGDGCPALCRPTDGSLETPLQGQLHPRAVADDAPGRQALHAGRRGLSARAVGSADDAEHRGGTSGEWLLQKTGQGAEV